MAGQKLDAVEARLGIAARAFARRRRQLLHQISGHRPRHGMEAVVGDRRRRIGDVAQAVAHAVRDAAGMRELAEDERTSRWTASASSAKAGIASSVWICRSGASANEDS